MLENYHKTIAEWLANDKQPDTSASDITINELLARFWVHAEGYYRDASGNQTSELGCIRISFRPFCKLYGHVKAVEFGPRCLRAVQQKMVQIGWCRNNINRSLSRVKMLFKWGVSQELVPSSVYHALSTVPGLRKGRSDAKESIPVKPVSQEYIDAIEPYVSRQVWALIQLQLLTGSRSGELVIMRPCDIDMSSKIWIYTPAHHKTAHHGHNRTIYIGPRGQDILQPFLLRPPMSYCFSPAEAMAEWRQKNYAKRKTPILRGNRAGTNVKDAARQAGKHYTPTGLGHTIAKAIKRAFRPDGMSDKEFKTWKPPQHWHPHQLRHNAATYLRKEFGLDTARIILGHRSAVITEVYAEMDQQKAMEAVVRVG